MKNIFIHNAFFRLLAPPILGVLVYLLILLLNNNVGQIDQIFSGEEVYICIGLSYMFTESFRLVIIIMEKLLKVSTTFNRVLVQSVVHIIVSVFLVSSGLWLYYSFVLGFSPGQFEYKLFNGIFLVVVILFVLMYFSHHYMHKENKLKLEQEKILKQGMEMEFLDFKKDINPHLLYQSLEQLLILVHKNTDRAEEYIDHLSTVYRYILGSKQIELVSLEEELVVLDELLMMLNEIYDNNVRLTCSGQGQSTYVVPGTFISILDYIARTTIITSHTPLEVVLHADEEGYLTVQHKLNERLIRSNDDQKELLKIIERAYGIFSEKPVVSVKAYEESYIKIPILAMEEQAAVI